MRQGGNCQLLAKQLPLLPLGNYQATAKPTQIIGIKMTEHQSQSDIDAPATNLLPFPATLAATATEQNRFYTADELKTTFTPGVATNRNVRHLVAQIKLAFSWLPDIEFKRGDFYTQFTFDQIKAMKDSGLTQKQWIAEVQKRSPITQAEQLPEANQSALAMRSAAAGIANNSPDLFSQIVSFTPATQTTQQVESIECEILETDALTGGVLSEFIGAIELSKTKTDELEEKQRLEDAKLVKQRLQAELIKRSKVKNLDNKFADMTDEELARLAQMAGLASPKTPVGNGLGV